MIEGIVHRVSGHTVRTVLVRADAEALANDVLAAVLERLERPTTAPGGSRSPHESSSASAPLVIIARPPHGGTGIAWTAEELAACPLTWLEWTDSTAAALVRTLDAGAAADRLGARAGTTTAPPQILGTLEGPRVEVLTGPDSGFAVSAPRAGIRVGRGPSASLQLADPFLSREPVAAPAGEQAVQLGSTRLRLVTGLPPQPAQEGPVPLPERPRLVAPRRPSWLLFAVPILIGIVLALAMHMWWFLAFSASGPLTAVITWWAERRRFRSDAAAALGTLRAGVDEYAQRVAQARTACVQSAWGGRQRGTTICLGAGSAVLPVPLEDAWEPDPELPQPVRSAFTRVLERARLPSVRVEGRRWATAPHAPLLVDLGAGALRLTGVRSTVSDAMRAAVVSLLAARVCVTVHGAAPAEFAAARLQLCGCAGEAETCPRVSPSGAADSAPVPRSGSSTAASVDVWLTTGQAVLMAGGAGGSAEEWWVHCRGDGGAQLRAPVSAAPIRSPVPLEGPIDLRRLRPERFAACCPLRPAAQSPGEHPGALDSLVAAARTERADTDEAVRASRDPHPVAWHPVPVGRGEMGPVCLDLVGDGPHALVAGTTGSGKSVFLQTWLLSLAGLHGPEALRFVLIDFKGGAAFAPLAGLPHVDSVTSNLGPTAALRALRSVRAEVLRREELLAAARAADIEAFNAGSDHRLARVILVIDEFQALVFDNPEGTEMLESLTALGRSLGIHIVLSTQRPAGIVTARMKANIALRIALRVRDPLDSREVIECDDAAALDARLPGSAIASTGSSRTRFRTATPVFHPPPPHRLHARWTVLECATAPARDGGDWDSAVLGWAVPPEQLLVDRLATTARPGVPPIVAPPLPAVIPASDGHAAGLIDVPDRCTTEPWVPEPAAGNILMTGGPRTGKSTVLVQVARAWRARGLCTIALAPPDSPCPADLTVAHGETWLLEYAIGLLERAHTPVGLLIDEWDTLSAIAEGSQRGTRLERLLAEAGAGLTFALVGGRRVLHGQVGARAATRIVFPPAAAQDAMYYGLSPGRFEGMTVPGRGVLIGSAAGGSDPSGVDLQVALPPAVGIQRTRVGADEAAEARARLSLLTEDRGLAPGPHWRLGRAPLGESVDWNPVHDGPVLSVYGPPERAERFLAELLSACGRSETDRHRDRTAAVPLGSGETASGCPRIVRDAHRAPAEEVESALEAGPCILTLPWGMAPGYGSPAARALTLGPSVLLGARSPVEHAEVGYRDLPLVPPACGLGWFASAHRSVPLCP